ncbi:MAG: SAM-dependent methyltransferase, partial [archaeon]
TRRMKVVQDILERDRSAWYANFAWRPAKLFDTVNRALTIFVVMPGGEGHTFSTSYQKWTSDDREGLFERIAFVEVPRDRSAFWVPKLGHHIEHSILNRILSKPTQVAHLVRRTEHRIYYRTTGGLYWKVFTDFPPAFRLNGKSGSSSRETSFAVATKGHVRPMLAVLSSDLFWWWYTVTSNLRDLNPVDIHSFPVAETAMVDEQLRALASRYIGDIDRNSTMLVREQKQTGRTETQSFRIQKSKPIIDEIDCVLARHYGLTEQELDFIINYDIKYRMGQDVEENGDG